MKQTIKIKEIIGVDVRSRSNMGIVRSAIDGATGNVILDFSGVMFISRSFADELCIMMENLKFDVAIIQTSDVVQAMLKVVSDGRKQKRVRREEKTEIREFKDIESLSDFLVAL